MPVQSDKVFSYGVIQDADGTMKLHTHPDGEPCVWCARGVPRFNAIRRVVEDGLVTITDVVTGEQVAEPYRLED
jgi:hypothetical protein